MLEYAKQTAFIYFTTRSLVANIYKKHQFPRLVYYVKSTISIKCWSWCHILHLYCLPREGDDPVVPGLPRDPLPHHLLHLLLAGVHQAEGCDVCSTVFEIFQLHHVQVLTGGNWQNLNSTTTQPNLTYVGLDTKMILLTPPPPQTGCQIA